MGDPGAGTEVPAAVLDAFGLTGPLEPLVSEAGGGTGVAVDDELTRFESAERVVVQPRG